MKSTTAPPAVRTDLAAIASQNRDRSFWDRIARKYARDKIKDMEGYTTTLDAVQKHLQSDFDVLELGCGTGMTALEMAGHVQAYTGTDISGEMITIAHERLAGTDHRNVSFEVGVAGAVETPAQGYDAVLGFNYLHLVPDLAETLAHIRGHTRQGGLFISKTPCLADTPMRFVFAPMIRVMRLLGKAPSSVLFFRKGLLSQAIQEAGFEIVDMADDHDVGGRIFIVARAT